VRDTAIPKLSNGGTFDDLEQTCVSELFSITLIHLHPLSTVGYSKRFNSFIVECEFMGRGDGSDRLPTPIK